MRQEEKSESEAWRKKHGKKKKKKRKKRCKSTKTKGRQKRCRAKHITPLRDDKYSRIGCEGEMKNEKLGK